MTDLVKRAREWLLSSQYNLPETAYLVRDMVDEIERLQKVGLALRHPYDAQKAFIEDMREWVNPEKAKTEDAHIILSDFLTTLDAYAKDRGIE